MLVQSMQLMYTELYDVEGCAAFVADFLAFEPLEDPLHPPEFLPSPMNTLCWQVRDEAAVITGASAHRSGSHFLCSSPSMQKWVPG